MIAALAILISQPLVLEYPEIGSERVTFQAIVSMPQMSSREWSAAQVLARVLPEETKSYNRYQLLRVATVAGDPIRCTVMPDHFRIQLTVPAAQGELGAKIIEDLLLNPRLDQARLKSIAENLTFERRDYWSEALLPFKLEAVKPQDATELHQRFFRAENIAIAAGGDFTPGQAKGWFQHFGEFTQPPRLLPRVEGAQAEPIAARSQAVTTITLLSEPVPSQALSFTTLLATHALGTGKWSSLHRLWREKEGISYWQESALLPDPEGFRLALVAAIAPRDDEPELAARMKKLVAEDVSAWTEEVRLRANGSIAGTLSFSGLPNPFYFQPGKPLTLSLEDRTFFKAYLSKKTGRDWSHFHAQPVDQIPTLAEIKDAATKLVEGMKPIIIHGG